MKSWILRALLVAAMVVTAAAPAVLAQEAATATTPSA